MDLDTFKDLVDRCGERSESWPPEIRPVAEAFLSQSTEAQELIKTYQNLTKLFEAAPVVQAPPGLLARILHQARISRG